MLEFFGDEIDATVGGIRLMVSSKFEQFRGLVEECATSYRVLVQVPRVKKNLNRTVKPPVKPEDLDGFWEMMNVQVSTRSALYK